MSEKLSPFCGQRNHDAKASCAIKAVKTAGPLHSTWVYWPLYLLFGSDSEVFGTESPLCMDFVLQINAKNKLNQF